MQPKPSADATESTPILDSTRITSLLFGDRLSIGTGRGQGNALATPVKFAECDVPRAVACLIHYSTRKF